MTCSDGGLMVVNDVALEKYVKGVIAGEMPAEWQRKRSKAQAVAARTYALASRKQDGTVRRLRGHAQPGLRRHRRRRTRARPRPWQRDEGRMVLRYEGKVAWTFFSASSGGRTAAIEDVWAGSEPDALPRVGRRSVRRGVSPYHRWGPVTFTAAELRAKLGAKLPQGLTGLTVELNASGTGRVVIAAGAGGTTEIPGSTMRTGLGLRSTWFTIETQGALTASAKRVVYGQAVRLQAVLGGAGSATVEAKPTGGSWQSLRTIAATRSGLAAVKVKPAVTTAYRLRLPSGRGAPVTVKVQPLITLTAGKRVFKGSVEPALAGAPVAIQRRENGRWHELATGEIGDDGHFSVRVRPRSGVYRARVAATPGLAAGASRPLTVGSA